MKIDLDYVLDEEKSIFEVFSSYKVLGDGSKIFWSKDSNQVPHWNMLYPANSGTQPSRSVLREALSHYESLGLTGHVLSVDPKLAPLAAESEEYFVLEGEASSPHPAPGLQEFSHIPKSDLEIFTSIVGETFDFDPPTRDFFHSKMQQLNSKLPSKFWVVSYQNEACGAASTFETRNGHPFLFNVAIRKKFQAQGLGSKMLAYIVQNSKRPLFTYSPNPNMRTKILPSIGGASVGTIFELPIAKVV